jgi:hypothetical protein
MTFLSVPFSLRCVSLIAVIASFIGAVIMFIFGALYLMQKHEKGSGQKGQVLNNVHRSFLISSQPVYRTV